MILWTLLGVSFFAAIRVAFCNTLQRHLQPGAAARTVAWMRAPDTTCSRERTCDTLRTSQFDTLAFYRHPQFPTDTTASKRDEAQP